jgi:hypothetical protein
MRGSEVVSVRVVVVSVEEEVDGSKLLPKGSNTCPKIAELTFTCATFPVNWTSQPFPTPAADPNSMAPIQSFSRFNTNALVVVPSTHKISPAIAPGSPPTFIIPSLSERTEPVSLVQVFVFIILRSILKISYIFHQKFGLKINLLMKNIRYFQYAC